MGHVVSDYHDIIVAVVVRDELVRIVKGLTTTANIDMDMGQSPGYSGSLSFE